MHVVVIVVVVVVFDGIQVLGSMLMTDSANACVMVVM
jgi:hypothetical protein